jgi:hypothetical protein
MRDLRYYGAVSEQQFVVIDQAAGAIFRELNPFLGRSYISCYQEDDGPAKVAAAFEAAIAAREAQACSLRAHQGDEA